MMMTIEILDVAFDQTGEVSYPILIRGKMV